MKEEILKIAKDLEQGTITEIEAQNLLLGLFDVSKRSGHQMLIDVLKNEYVQNTITKEMVNKIKNEIRNPDSWKDIWNVC